MDKGNTQRKKHFIYALLIFVATIFMGIGYAAIDGVLLNIDGTASAINIGTLYITNVIYDSDNGANTISSNINGYTGTTMNSTVELGSVATSSITYAVTIYNTTGDNYKYMGTSFSAPEFYDNTNITFDVTGINVGDNLDADSHTTIYITFRYAGSNTSNPVLNSYISFDFVKYYTVTYQHISNNNYPAYILDSESVKNITFTGDIPYDVSITPNVSYSYNNGVLSLNNVKNNITIDRYYSITYVTAGTNAQNQPTKYLHGSVVTFLTPTNGSSIFDGWFRDSNYNGSPIIDTTGLNEDLTLYAKWTSNTYQNAATFISSLVGNASTSSTDVITLDPPTGETCTNTLAYDGTSDNNLRYVGTNPCNYVKFNCDSNNNCETWRIVGVMNGMDTNPVLKISAPIPTSRVWDTKNTKVWDTSDLKTYLNGTYLTSLNAGVQNDYILNAQWNAGAAAYNSNPTTIYNAEKGTKVTAYVGIISPSDYAFSSSGNANTTRSSCINSNMNSFAANCYNNTWIFSGTNQWTITAQSSGNGVLRINTGGSIARTNANQSASDFRPTVYIKPNIQINTISGNGSQNSPYELYVSGS